MTAKDFQYDGQYLSDYSFIIGSIDSKSGVATVSAGSKITFNTVPIGGGKRFSMTSSKYEECYTTTFSIVKNPWECDEQEITSDEYRDLIRWLNRREFLPFYFIEDDGETCYYNASFTVEKILINNRLYGLSLTMMTDSPFGYGQDVHASWTIADTDRVYLLADISDEIGYTYPRVSVTCNKDGDLEIYNETWDCRTLVKNCSIDETITFHGDTKIIETDNETHAKTISRDFNFNFPKIGNTIKTRSNKFRFTLPCKCNISYTPIIK